MRKVYGKDYSVLMMINKTIKTIITRMILLTLINKIIIRIYVIENK
jgi:hypothetical protein